MVRFCKFHLKIKTVPMLDLNIVASRSNLFLQFKITNTGF